MTRRREWKTCKHVMKYLETLIKDMEDCSNWQILGIVEVTEENHGDKTYGKVEGDKTLYEKQDDEFIRQWAGCCEDDYHGILLKPLTDGKFLKISYNC